MGSEKKDKRYINRALRRKAKKTLNDDNRIEPKKEEIMDRWNMSKDRS